MKVFISSVRRGLGPERDYLPELILACGHTPLRFEDFGAQDLTSRGACLGGVQEADIYLLILGPHYGTEVDDSGLSPTEEEFNVAMERGIPVYVFVQSGIAVDLAQREFMDRVGNYKDGRFWAEFADHAELGVHVARVLREHREPAPPFRQMALTSQVQVPWRTGQLSVPQTRDGSPVLEVHVLPIESTALRPVAHLAELAVQLASDARRQGFFGHGNALDIASDTELAWAVRADDGVRRGGWNEVRLDPYAGVYVTRGGAVAIFQTLPSDTLGSLVDEQDLAQRFTILLRHVVPYLPEAEHITVAAAIDPADRVMLGDPSTVGHRNSGHMGLGRGKPVRADPADQVPTPALAPHLHDVSRDLAARIAQALRHRR